MKYDSHTGRCKPMYIIALILLLSTVGFALLAWRNAYQKPCDYTDLREDGHIICVYDNGPTGGIQ